MTVINMPIKEVQHRLIALDAEGCAGSAEYNQLRGREEQLLQETKTLQASFNTLEDDAIFCTVYYNNHNDRKNVIETLLAIGCTLLAEETNDIYCYRVKVMGDQKKVYALSKNPDSCISIILWRDQK